MLNTLCKLEPGREYSINIFPLLNDPRFNLHNAREFLYLFEGYRYNNTRYERFRWECTWERIEKYCPEISLTKWKPLEETTFKVISSKIYEHFSPLHRLYYYLCSQDAFYFESNVEIKVRWLAGWQCTRRCTWFFF